MQKLIKPLLTKKGYLIFSVIVVILFSAWVIPDAMKAEVVIATDEETKVVKTSKETVGDLLEEIGISVSDHDHISHPTNTELEDGMEISYKKAKKINLQIDEEKEQYFTTKDTVGQFLDEQNISLNEHDELSHKRIEKIEEGLTVKIDRAFQVVIDDGGDEKKVWTTGGTVGQILADEAIHYDELDKIKPSLNEKVTEETSDIQIVHVELETEKIEETIDFEVEERKDDSLEKGKKETITDGEEGIVEKIYEVTYENGKETERKLVEEEVKKESKNKVVAIGTKEKQAEATVSSTQSSNEKSRPSGGKELVVQATAYTANCNGCSGYTATGINLNANPNAKVIAVDPNVIPLGSKVWVEGYGTAIAGDTGGNIQGNRIDAHVPTQGDAQSFGRKTVRVKVLD